MKTACSVFKAAIGRPFASPLFRASPDPSRTARALLALAALGGVCLPARAVTRRVPADYPTITAALAASGSGDIIEVAAGSYPENLQIGTNVDLRGAGAGATTIDGRGANTVVSISSGANVVIRDVTVTNGTPSGPFGFGGGVYNEGTLQMDRCDVRGNSAPVSGGGLFNFASATMTLVACGVHDNTASVAGGIDNGGLLTIQDSAIYANAASSSSGIGGGMLNSGVAHLTNCTVSGNEAESGGGLYIQSGQVDLNSVTVSANTATSGGGIENDDTLHAVNSIIAGNTATNAPDVTGTLTSGGYNLIGSTDGTTITGTTTGNITGVSPGLGPLQDNGGPTPTQALLLSPRSPAIDAGPPSGFPAADQRGVPRPQGPAADIGAFELQAVAPFLRADVTRALRIAGGLDAAALSDVSRLNVVAQNASASVVDIADAVRLARKVAGTDANP